MKLQDHYMPGTGKPEMGLGVSFARIQRQVPPPSGRGSGASLSPTPSSPSPNQAPSPSHGRRGQTRSRSLAGLPEAQAPSQPEDQASIRRDSWNLNAFPTHVPWAVSRQDVTKLRQDITNFNSRRTGTNYQINNFIFDMASAHPLTLNADISSTKIKISGIYILFPSEI